VNHARRRDEKEQWPQRVAQIETLVAKVISIQSG
jgi:hypothetical protein